MGRIRRSPDTLEQKLAKKDLFFRLSWLTLRWPLLDECCDACGFLAKASENARKL